MSIAVVKHMYHLKQTRCRSDNWYWKEGHLLFNEEFITHVKQCNLKWIQKQKKYFLKDHIWLLRWQNSSYRVKLVLQMRFEITENTQVHSNCSPLKWQSVEIYTNYFLTPSNYEYLTVMNVIILLKLWTR